MSSTETVDARRFETGALVRVPEHCRACDREGERIGIVVGHVAANPEPIPPDAPDSVERVVVETRELRDGEYAREVHQFVSAEDLSPARPGLTWEEAQLWLVVYAGAVDIDLDGEVTDRDQASRIIEEVERELTDLRVWRDLRWPPF